MNVYTEDGRTFRLVATNEDDQKFVDALDHARHVAIASVNRERVPYTVGTVNVSCDLIVARNSEQALLHDAGRQALRALGDLFRLGLGQAAHDGHVGGNPVDPQPQVALASVLVQLQDVTNALRACVGEAEFVREKVDGAHGDSSGGSTIVAREGA